MGDTLRGIGFLLVVLTVLAMVWLVVLGLVFVEQAPFPLNVILLAGAAGVTLMFIGSVWDGV